MYPFTRTFFIFLPYPNPFPSQPLLLTLLQASHDPAYSPPFFSHRSHPRQRSSFLVFLFLSPSRIHPFARAPLSSSSHSAAACSFSPSPSPSRPRAPSAPYRVLLVELYAPHPSDRPFARTSTAPPLPPPPLPPNPCPSTCSHPSLSDSSCVIDVRRCTGLPDIFHAFVHLIATSRLRDEHLLIVRYVLLLLATRAYPQQKQYPGAQQSVDGQEHYFQRFSTIISRNPLSSCSLLLLLLLLLPWSLAVLGGTGVSVACLSLSSLLALSVSLSPPRVIS